MIEKYEQLSEFLGCYFHQDWKIRAKTEEEAIELYINEFHPCLVDQCLSEIDHLLNQMENEEMDVDDILLRIFHVGYYFPNFEFNGKEWLEHLKSLIINAKTGAHTAK